MLRTPLLYIGDDCQPAMLFFSTLSVSISSKCGTLTFYLFLFYDLWNSFFEVSRSLPFRFSWTGKRYCIREYDHHHGWSVTQFLAKVPTDAFLFQGSRTTFPHFWTPAHNVSDFFDRIRGWLCQWYLFEGSNEVLAARTIPNMIYMQVPRQFLPSAKLAPLSRILWSIR